MGRGRGAPQAEWKTNRIDREVPQNTSRLRPVTVRSRYGGKEKIEQIQGT
jgi:hypothetical protein